jgi:HlyD family secretion protein
VLATDLRTLKLTAGVDEADIGRIRPGMDVTFTVEAYGQQEFAGTVNAVRLNATNQNNVITYPVWIDVPNPDLKLRPSMTASLKIVISRASNVVRVPSAALRFRPNNDIYTALGLEAPAPGRGNRPPGMGTPETRNEGGRGGRQGQDQAGAPAQGGQGANAQTAAPGNGAARGGQAAQNGDRQPGQGRNRQFNAGGGGRGGRQGGTGFGRGQSNLTPEQLAQMRERFGRGGGAAQGGRGARPAANQVPQTELNAEKIDDLFAEVQKRIEPGTVWTWDEAKKELKQIQIRQGVTDGTWAELISGELQVGQELVTNVIIPMAQRTTPTGQNPLFGNQPGRGFGGDRGGGGGGNRGGGGPGGGGGGGRGGGGR